MLSPLLLAAGLLPQTESAPFGVLVLEAARALEAGAAEQALEPLRRARELEDDSPGADWLYAAALARVGERRAALAMLAEIAEASEGCVALLDWDRDFDSIRAEPEFAELRERFRAADREREAAGAIDSSSRPLVEAVTPTRYTTRLTRIAGVQTEVDDGGRRTVRVLLRDRETGRNTAALNRSGEWLYYATLTPSGREVVTISTPSPLDPLSVLEREDNRDVLRVIDPLSGRIQREIRLAASYLFPRFDEGRNRLLLLRYSGACAGAFDLSTWNAVGPAAPEAAVASHGIARSERVELVFDTTLQGRIALAGSIGSPLWVACEDGSLVRVDPTTGREEARCRHGQRRLRALATSPLGDRVATIDETGVLRLVEGDSLGLIGEVQALEPGVVPPLLPAMRFTGDGSRLVLTPVAGRALVFGADDLRRRQAFGTADPSLANIWGMDLEGRRLVLLVERDALRVHETETGQPFGPTFRLPAAVGAVALEKSGDRLWIGTVDSRVHVLETATGRSLAVLDHRDLDAFGPVQISDLSFSPDGTRALVASSGFGSVACWSTATYGRQWSAESGVGNGASLRARFSADGSRAFVWGQGPRTVAVFDATDGRRLQDFDGLDVRRLHPLDGAERVAVDQWGSALSLLAIETGAASWHRFELRDAGWLLVSPDGYFDGSPNALEALHAETPSGSIALARLAPRLLDPKRVAAAAAGVELPPARTGPEFDERPER